ncbi:MAG: FimV/HubP family polar landmark protein [Aquisalimonadaceae bacterium]
MVSALGLGNIETRSALNEPLDARIPLNVTAEELQSLRVSLAPAEAFQRAGLDRPFLLSRLNFEVVTEDDASPYVRVTTESGVREPFVAFLVEIRWAGGRLLREYTMLLDPPVYTPRERAPAPTRAADAAPSPAADPDPSARPAPGRVSSPDAVTEAREAAAAGEYGPVQRNETAWDIAMAARPDSNVSVHQMMMALVTANPQAFPDGNANNLRAGAILRIPSRSEIESLSVAEARREFARQVEAWRASRSPVAADADEGEEGEPEVAVADEPESRLQVVGIDDQSGADATASLTDEALQVSEANTRALQREVTTLRESEADLRAENEELRRMAEEMRQRMEALERSVNIPADPGLPAESTGDQPSEELVPVPDGTDSTLDVDESALPEESERETGAPGEPAVQEAPDSEPAEAATPSEPATPPRVEPFVPDNEAPWENPMLQMLGGGVLLVLLVLLMLVMRRRRRAREDDEAILTGSALGLATGADQRADDDTLIARSAAAPMPAGVDEPTEFDGDPLEQADAYMSQGRNDDAADTIIRGLAADPDNRDLRLKMLELHAENQDRGAFEADAQELYGLIEGQNDPVWVRASELGRDIAPENPLFSSADDFGEVSLTDDSLDDALDLGDDPSIPERALAGRASAAEESAGNDDADDLSDLDFSLDEPFQDEDVHVAADPEPAKDSEPSRREEPEAAADDLSMDFDLDALSSSMDSDADQNAPAAEPEAAEMEDDGFGLDFQSPPPRTESGPVAEDVPSSTDDDAGLSFDLDQAGFEDADTGSDLAAVSAPAEAAEGEDDDDLFENTDENGTKLDLARAYLDMGDSEGARSLLEEVIEEGNDEQKREAQVLVDQAG